MASSMQIEFNKAAIVRNKKLHGAGYVMQEKKGHKNRIYTKLHERVYILLLIIQQYSS